MEWNNARHGIQPKTDPKPNPPKGSKKMGIGVKLKGADEEIDRLIAGIKHKNWVIDNLIDWLYRAGEIDIKGNKIIKED